MDGRAIFKRSVILRSAKVGGVLSMIGSVFEGALDMNSLRVGSGLLMRDGATFKDDVTLAVAKVGGNLEMTSSTFERAVNMQNLQVDHNLFMRSGVFKRSIWLMFARVGGNLDLWGAHLASVNLTSTRVGGELRLGSSGEPSPKWSKGAQLILRNAHVGAFQDRWNSEAWNQNQTISGWPSAVEMDGFTYERLGGALGGGASEMNARDLKWYVAWLKLDRTYSSQPYQQLAEKFRAVGDTQRANAILYEGRERERREVASGLRWWGLTALNFIIGYGYGAGYFYALFWVTGFVFVGAIVLRLSGEGRRNGIQYGFSYSLDHLLPVIQLRKYHYDKVDLEGWARYYFYFHKLMGYVLASFLIAGLAGLTK
jgi:hypothetical protein